MTGQSRGGGTAKIHAIAAGERRTTALLLTPGRASGISGARLLVAALSAPAGLIADKAYHADDLRAFLINQGTRPVVSHMPSRRANPPSDLIAYRQRHQMERALYRLKDWRIIAARYNKTVRDFLAGICLALAATALIRWI